MEWNNSGVEKLRGKTITKVEVSDWIIKFHTKDEQLVFTVEADCCSESWISDIINFHNLIGHTINSIQELDTDSYNTEDGRGRQDCDSVYGITFVTEEGKSFLIYRNSSNGYYGGWIQPMSTEAFESCVKLLETKGNQIKFENIESYWYNKGEEYWKDS